MIDTPATAGDLLREWRHRRHLSQLGLATEAEISQRHLSFVESGRAQPSRDMVLHLSEHLAIPLRQRNAILAAAGFAPVYRERSLYDPDFAAARGAVNLILEGHAPHPALAVDRHWTLVSANKSVGPLLAGITDTMLAAPLNVLRLSLHPDGLSSRIVNFREWREHILLRLERQVDASADPGLIMLLEELKDYPVPPDAKPWRQVHATPLGGIAVPLELAVEGGTLRFISTTTVFGTAVDIALAELTIESFFPADAFTAQAMRQQEAEKP
jgi:transcriptional regulator with XRE-family HTH domain